MARYNSDSCLLLLFFTNSQSKKEPFQNHYHKTPLRTNFVVWFFVWLFSSLLSLRSVQSIVKLLFLQVLTGEVRKQDVFILKELKQLHFALQSACTDITLLLVSLFWQELWCYSSSSKQVLCRTRRQITDLSLNAWITVKHSKWSCIKSRGRHTSAALISHWQGTVAVKIQSVAQSTGDPEIKSLFIHPGIFNITHIC